MANSPTILPIAEWMPDLPDYPGAGSANARNVYPRTPISYGAFQAPVAFSSALGNRCQGAAAFLDLDGATNMVAGDASKLYRLVAGDAYVWQDVSKAGGYSPDPKSQWEFTYFNGSVLATDFADPIQTLNLMSGSQFNDLAGAAPHARHLGVIKNAFVMVGNTTDTTNGNKPQRVWWCAAGDATNWPTPGSTAAATVQAGAVDLLGDDGAVQAIRSGLTAADGLVFQQYGIHRAVYAGPPVIFDFLPAQNARGTPAPWSPVVLGGVCYFLGWDGWYACDGGAVTPIGVNKIDKTFMDDLDFSNIDRVVGVPDPVNKLILWAYPGAGNNQGNPNHLLIYNWALDRWTIADVECEMLCWMLTLGYTLDQLGTILGYTIDNLPAPLDSPFWQGGSLRLGVFDLNHKLNFFVGANLAPTVETQEIQLFPGRIGRINGARPLIDATGSVVPSVALGRRNRLQDAVATTSPSALNSVGVCPFRHSSRYVRATLTMPAGSAWTNISGVELDAVPQGTR